MKVRALYFVEITVTNWILALAWYKDMLGLEEVQMVEADQFALLRAGQAQLALKGGEAMPGTMQLTFEVEDLEQALQHLAAWGVTLESPLQTSPEGYRDVVIRDPDGYRVCLFDWACEKRQG
jgi:catechol 2,3-dioxygenase-like lactoylglutathione lyase family enzyme